MPQSEWPARLTRSIAAEIRRWRQARKLSAQQLADKCRGLGLEISRSTLADLENGRRPVISVAELLVLAAALNVPPALLVAPLGYSDRIEVLAELEMSALDAVQWISGDVALVLDGHSERLEYLDADDPGGTLALHREHHDLVEELRNPDEWVARFIQAVENGAPRGAKAVQDDRRLREQELRAVRARMRERGQSPPELPAELAGIEDSETVFKRRQ